jgi:murein DD-endopeptidase MepM/ murein hydrolase activator NlpD
MSDQIPHEPEAVSVEDADGNHIIQDIGNGAHVLYAHMKKGSVRSRVRVGQKVRKGQVIGLVGNTGNTIAPHLHLHVTDAPSALEADGIPYVFERFRLTGFDALGTADFDKGERFGTPLSITPVVPPSSHRRELPLDLVIVDWLHQ